MAGFLPRGEVRRPEDAPSPGVDLTGRGQVAPEDCLACVHINQRKLLRVILLSADDDRLFGGLNIVADLVDDYRNLACTRLGRETAQTNR